jgi:hypothetical protein
VLPRSLREEVAKQVERAREVWRGDQDLRGALAGNVSVPGCKSHQAGTRGSRAKAQRRKGWVPSIYSPLPLRLGGFARDPLLPMDDNLAEEWVGKRIMEIRACRHSSAHHSSAILFLADVRGVARRRMDVQSEANEGRSPPLPPPSCWASSFVFDLTQLGTDHLTIH